MSNFNKLKKSICVLLSATFIGTIAGCSKKDYINYYNNYYIKESVVLKYKDDNENIVSVVIYPHFYYDLLFEFEDELKLEDFNKKVLFSKKLGDFNSINSENIKTDEALKDYGDLLGKYLSYESFEYYVISKYGRKNNYTKDEINELINEIENLNYEDNKNNKLFIKN